MADQKIDLSHLRGAELERVARSLTAGHIEAVLADKDAILALNAEHRKSLQDLIRDLPVANCGGFGCG